MSRGTAYGKTKSGCSGVLIHHDPRFRSFERSRTQIGFAADFIIGDGEISGAEIGGKKKP
jgi:hypothetical protein